MEGNHSSVSVIATQFNHWFTLLGFHDYPSDVIQADSQSQYKRNITFMSFMSISPGSYSTGTPTDVRSVANISGYQDTFMLPDPP